MFKIWGPTTDKHCLIMCSCTPSLPAALELLILPSARLSSGSVAGRTLNVELHTVGRRAGVGGSVLRSASSSAMWRPTLAKYLLKRFAEASSGTSSFLKCWLGPSACWRRSRHISLADCGLEKKSVLALSRSRLNSLLRDSYVF